MQWMILLAAGAFLWWQDNVIAITKIPVQSPKVPDGFDQFRIAQISDLHNKRFGKGQKRLLQKLSEADPGLIVVTGDLIDKRRTAARRMSPAFEFLAGARKIAPVVYVCGNHEQRRPALYELLKRRMEELGIQNLDDCGTSFSHADDAISLIGLMDRTSLRKAILETVPPVLSNLCCRYDGFRVLLAHRPDLFSLYAAEKVDLIFSGHAHGGQIRLPGIGGILAPHQGFFPRLTSGLHQKAGSQIVVSRGLGNSLFPLRIFNRPELVIVTLEKTDKNKKNSR